MSEAVPDAELLLNQIRHSPTGRPRRLLTNLSRHFQKQLLRRLRSVSGFLQPFRASSLELFHLSTHRLPVRVNSAPPGGIRSLPRKTN